MNHARKPRPISDEEEAAIQAGTAQDPDNPEWTEAEMAVAKPFAEVFPELAEAIERSRSGTAAAKTSVSVQLDQDVVEVFQASGPGWQARINLALRKAAGL